MSIYKRLIAAAVLSARQDRTGERQSNSMPQYLAAQFDRESREELRERIMRDDGLTAEEVEEIVPMAGFDFTYDPSRHGAWGE